LAKAAIAQLDFQNGGGYGYRARMRGEGGP
jgi:hypothetical protein